MMKQYFTEAEEDIQMDVQVGPEKEVEAEVGEPAKTIAKADDVKVVCNKNEDGVCEFYVDFDDVANYTVASEQSIIESLNAIIEANEGSGLGADNLTVVLSEETAEYEKELSEYGVTCCVSEAEQTEDTSVEAVREQARQRREAEGVTLECVYLAKADARTLPVSAVTTESGDVFFVEAADVATFAELNEMSMVDALNAIIAAHEGSGMDADNLAVMIDESTKNYAPNLDSHGVTCVLCEADDIEMDVQVGPEGEKQVAEDPQVANPVDAVKRNYDSVIVALKDKEFFTDVEDVQKCAELNCESVIDTLNKMLDVNEEAGVTCENLNVVISDETPDEIVKEMADAGVNLVY